MKHVRVLNANCEFEIPMRIIINHLTRMQKGFICVAGLETKTQRHIRPVVHGRLGVDFLARGLGPFEIAHEIDIGATAAIGKAPEIEDHTFDYRRALSVRAVKPVEYWDLLTQVSRRSLRDIFGPQLEAAGVAYSVPEGQGDASLGSLIPQGHPALFIQSRPNRPPQVRMRFSDGALKVDASVTDIRLYGADHVTPDETMVEQVNERIRQGVDAILSVGLGRPYAAAPGVAPRHWLQVNNIHLADRPVWLLG